MEELRNELSTEQGEVDKKEWLAKVMADPDVKKILEARQKQEDAEPPESEEDLDLDVLDNRELVRYILKKVQESVGGLVAKHLDGIAEKVGRLEGYVQEKETRTIRQQVDELRAKYPDFDDYRELMIQLSRESPGLTPEELYWIARKRSGRFEEPGPKTESEKPTSTLARPPRREREKPLPPGARGFSQLLGEALEELELPS